MKTIFTLLILLTVSLAQAGLKVGTYKGEDNENDYRLHVRALPEREGSFLALLVKKDNHETMAFLIDPYIESRYGLSRIYPKANYIMGPMSNTPEAVLTVSNKRFTISKNPNVDFGHSLRTPISFKLSSRSSLRWKELAPGNYGSKSVIVSPLNGFGEASLSNNGDGGSIGEYVLRQSRPALYISLRSEVTSTGIRMNKDVVSYVYFLEVTVGRDLMVAIDSRTGKATVVKRDLFQ